MRRRKQISLSLEEKGNVEMEEKMEMEKKKEKKKLLKASQKPRRKKTKCLVEERTHVQPIKA